MPGPAKRLAAVCAVSVCAVAAAAVPQPAVAGERELTVLQRIDKNRRETWRWQKLMGKPRTPTNYTARRVQSTQYRRWVLDLWTKRAAKTRRQAARPPHERAWRCIQRYEGPWDDPGAPYYGGLQMDIAFQRAYGRDLLRQKGTADNWTPVEQMWVGERALRAGRGFHPWPHTARLCGLL